MADPEYEARQRFVLEAIRGDALWTVTASRRALFLAGLAWVDAQALLREPLTRWLADQLLSRRPAEAASKAK